MYRMNEVIMGWASDQLYDSLLTAHESVRHHLLRSVKIGYKEMYNTV